LLEEPQTVSDIAGELFASASGYHELLAIQEAGAHIEYLAQRGYLGVENYPELDKAGPVAVRYVRRMDGPSRLPPKFGYMETHVNSSAP
jgi:hypothetical protein